MQIVGAEARLRRVGGGEETEREAGQPGDEKFLVAGIPQVAVGKVAEEGGARVEVVAVLLAADTGRAVAVTHGGQRRVAIGFLNWCKGTEGSTPATAPLEQNTADEGQR